nr:uncharacterized protein LOC109763802 [Aegilops tauschii subsp. strangulata]
MAREKADGERGKVGALRGESGESDGGVAAGGPQEAKKWRRHAQLPPGGLGSWWDYRRYFSIKPVKSDALGAGVGGFFATDAKKVAWGRSWGLGWRCSKMLCSVQRRAYGTNSLASTTLPAPWMHPPASSGQGIHDIDLRKKK